MIYQIEIPDGAAADEFRGLVRSVIARCERETGETTSEAYFVGYVATATLRQMDGQGRARDRVMANLKGGKG